MVEVSIPELFSANLRKLGELVLDASQEPGNSRDFQSFVFARVPNMLLFLKEASRGSSSFMSVPSNLEFHTPLFRCSGEIYRDRVGRAPKPAPPGLLTGFRFS
jgi:hypothetical protein